MKRLSYPERLTIAIDGNDKTIFYTYSGIKIAIGYSRIVIGGRGPYIEFTDDHILLDSIHVPASQRHRLDNDALFYDEFRSNDQSNIKIYHQKNTVGYADYLIGHWYIDPSLLKTNTHNKLLLPLYEEEVIEQEVPQKTIFDVL